MEAMERGTNSASYAVEGARGSPHGDGAVFLPGVANQSTPYFCAKVPPTFVPKYHLLLTNTPIVGESRPYGCRAFASVRRGFRPSRGVVARHGTRLKAWAVLAFLLMAMGFGLKAEPIRYDVGSVEMKEIAEPIDFSKPVEFVGELPKATAQQTIIFYPDRYYNNVPAAIYTFSGTGAVFSAALVTERFGWTLSSERQNVYLGEEYYQLTVSASSFRAGAKYVVRFGNFDPFEVQFYGNGGTPSLDRDVYTPGKAYGHFPTAVRQGYDFNGWATAVTNGILLSTSDTVCLGYTNLFAQWTKIIEPEPTPVSEVVTNYVVFLPNGGTGNMATQTFVYGEAQALTSNAFSRTGYTFNGWAKTASDIVAYSDGQVVSNLSDVARATVPLYASWSAASDAVREQTVNGVLWRYTVSAGEAEVQNIVGTSHVAAVSTSLSGTLTIPETLGGATVTAIGDYAFYGCYRLTGIEIPPTVTSIGSYAFAACTNLSPGITIPESVDSMGSYVFQGCLRLRVVRYLGDSPNAGTALYAGAPSGLVSGVLTQRSGWEKEEMTIDLPGGATDDDGGSANVATDGTATDDGTSGDKDTATTGDGSSVTVTRYVAWPSGSHSRPVLRWIGVTLYALQFRANGGEPLDEDDRIQYYVPGRASKDLPEPSHANEDMEFVGWYTASVGGTLFSEGDVVDKSYILYAHWRDATARGASEWAAELYDDDEPFAAASAATFDGYIYTADGTNESDGVVSGIVSLKVAKGKYNREDETTNAAVTATVQLLGGGKIKLKGTMGEDGSASLADAAEEHGMELQLGANGFTGTFDDAEASGARNRFASRVSADVDACRCALQDWKRTWNIVLRTEEATGEGAAFAQGYSVLSVSVGARGKTKVKGTLADGTKVSASTQLIVGDSCCCVPVILPLYGGKRGGLAFLLWLSEEYESVWGLSAWDATSRSGGPFTAVLEAVGLCEAGTSSLSEGEAEFALDGEFELGEDAEALAEFLPDSVPVAVTGGRWTLPKAGRVKYDRAEEDFVATSDDNPSGLKLTSAAKDGTFKGSFKVYAAVSETRLKTYTATVTGAVVDGVGYGTATVKKVGSLPVRIE